MSRTRTTVTLAGVGVLLLAGAALAAALYVEKPAPVLIKRGKTAPLIVTIIRKDFNGPVELLLENLPRGVTLDDATAKISGDTRRYTLRASSDAQLVTSRSVTLTVKGGDNLSATTTFELTVRMNE